jgi:uncharacterized protein YcbX
MQIQQISLSGLKGGRHSLRPSVQLNADGPEGDRLFALIDLKAGRVLRTVENPLLVGCEALWQNGVLAVSTDGSTTTGTPVPTGDILTLEYWEREVMMQVVDGPWALPFSRLLGREVVMARINQPGGVVYGDTVTLVTTSSLRSLAEQLHAGQGQAAQGHGGTVQCDGSTEKFHGDAGQSGTSLDPRRFRATFTVGTGNADAYVEDSWCGRELDLGQARVLVGEGIPRCAVIDSDPDTGARGTKLLKTLAATRLKDGDIPFGVYARVIQPGLVTNGDSAQLLA